MSQTLKRRRLLIVLLIVLIVAGGLGAVHQYRSYRSRVYYANLRAAGLNAAVAGDAAGAIASLEIYIARHPEDVEALLAYVKYRPLVATDQGEHLSYTIVGLRHLLRLEPDRIPQRRQLLKLYIETGYFAEALDSAKLLYEKYGDRHAETLRGKAIALARLRQHPEALVAANEWVKAAPRDLEALMLDLSLMSTAKRADEEIWQVAAHAFQNPPDLARAHLLRGHARLMQRQQNPQQAIEHLTEAAKLGPDDDHLFGSLLVRELDATGLSELATSFVQRMYARESVSELRYELARRYWEAGRSDELNQLLATPRPDDVKMASALVGVHAISLQSVGREADSRRALEILRERKGDAGATAWVAVAEDLGAGTSGDPARVIVACQRAIEQNQADSYLRFFMGEMYARVGEPELSLRIWRESAELNQTWPAPLVRMSQVLLDLGRYESAYEAAELAMKRAQSNGVARLALVQAWTRCVDVGLRQGTELQLLSILTSASQPTTQASTRPSGPPPEVALMRAIVLQRLGRKPEAISVLEDALAQSPAFDEATLLRFAEHSRRFGLGLDDKCLERCEREYGMSANLAMILAGRQLAAGQATKGLMLLEAARTAAGGDKAPRDWQINWGHYLDLAEDPRARSFLIALAEAEPNDPQVQKMAIAARAMRGESQTRDRAVERLRKLSGEQSLGWRVAKAKVMLEQRSDGPSPPEAIALLQDVIQRAPNWAEARALLGTALIRDKRYPEAIEQIRLARDIVPDSRGLQLQLLKLYQESGEFQKAREEAARIVASGPRSGERREVAAVLAAQGETSQAITLLEQSNEDDAGVDIMLAYLYKEVHQRDKASDVLQKLLEKSPDTKVVMLSAELLAQQGKEQEADLVLEKLDKMSLEAGLARLFKSEYLARRNRIDAAIAMITPATEVAPTNPLIWRSLMKYYVYEGRFDDAWSTLAKARVLNPGDPSLAAIDERKSLLEASKDPKLRGLVLGFISDPTAKNGASEALDVAFIQANQGLDQSKVRARLHELSTQYPRLAVLHLVLAQKYLDDVKDLDNATAAARRAAQVAPNFTAPYELLVAATARADRWTECLDYAAKWRDRARESPIQAELAMARAYIKLGQPDNARTLLNQYTRDPNSPQFAVAMAVLSEANLAAKAELEPLLRQGPMGRTRYIAYAGSRLDAEEATAWLHRAAVEIPADSVQEQLALAEAWSVLAQRNGDEPRLESEAMKILKPLAEKPDANPMAILAMASHFDILSQRDGRDESVRRRDAKAAEVYYRRFLAAGPTPIKHMAQNNLAMLLSRNGGDLAEARALIDAAIATRRDSASLYDTRAFVLSRSGENAEAVRSMYQAVQLQSEKVEYRLQLAELLLQTGQRDQAKETLADLDKMQEAIKSLSTKAQRRLATLRTALADRTAAAVPGT